MPNLVFPVPAHKHLKIIHSYFRSVIEDKRGGVAEGDVDINRVLFSFLNGRKQPGAVEIRRISVRSQAGQVSL
jgi:hypothetical protein